jgi:general secretion pathway protein D
VSPRILAALALCCWLPVMIPASPADAQRRSTRTAKSETSKAKPETVHMDFKDADLTVVIEMIARTTGRNFIYDDKVRGKVTIVSPTPVSLEEAYAVFESVLRVKGFTVITGPAGVLQIIPIRDAKQSNVEIIRDDRPSANRDHFVTRLIPLLYIDAEAITKTIKPLVSKDASMVAYGPTNTIILTDTATNIRRLLKILDTIDVETFREELAVIAIEHADAATLGGQLSEIYGAEVAGGTAGSATAARRARASRRSRSNTAATDSTPSSSQGKIRIITDSRTNSLILLASRRQLENIRGLIRTLDVPVIGGGRIHVHYLKHADAEELAETLNGLLTGQRRSSGGGRAGAQAAQPQNIRAAVTALAEGIQLNADPATNSLVIQASREAYDTLKEVIDQLDIERPQVLVEALIMEVQVNDSNEFGMNVAIELNKAFDLVIASAAEGAVFGLPGLAAAGGRNFVTNFRYESGDTTIQAILRAAQSDTNANVVAAPHLLTSDNEEAEIQIGQNIPIITNRVNTATGNVTGQTTSVAVERQDVGVTLRVRPQISEGDTLRLQIFQENTTVVPSVAGSVEEVGVTLAKRNIENTLVVADGQTVVIGGLLSEQYTDTVAKTPYLGDIPVLGWFFKTQVKTVEKINLLIFLTPHIVRSPADMEFESIRKRRQFEERLGGGYLASGHADDRAISRTKNPAKAVLREQARRYPLSRMREIEEQRSGAMAAMEQQRTRALDTDRYVVTAGVFHDENHAAERLTILIDRGYDGILVAAEADDLVVFELRIGPYDTLREAEGAAEVLNEAFGLSTGVMLNPRERSSDVPDVPQTQLEQFDTSDRP